MFTHTKKLGSLFFFGIIFSCGVFAQPQNDFRAVVGLSIEKKISRSFSVSFLNNEIINQNLSEVALGFADLGLNYRLNRNFSFGANYRFAKSRNLQNYFDDRQMIYADINYQKFFHRFNLNLRSRIQNQYYPHLFDNSFRPYQTYNRNRLQLRYKLKYYFSLFTSIENFLYLNRNTGRKLTDIRYSSGLNYTFNENVKTEFYFSFDDGLNRINRINYFSLGATCYLKF